jgi:hypothetical protein
MSAQASAYGSRVQNMLWALRHHGENKNRGHCAGAASRSPLGIMPWVYRWNKTGESTACCCGCYACLEGMAAAAHRRATLKGGGRARGGRLRAERWRHRHGIAPLGMLNNSLRTGASHRGDPVMNCTTT